MFPLIMLSEFFIFIIPCLMFAQELLCEFLFYFTFSLLFLSLLFTPQSRGLKFRFHNMTVLNMKRPLIHSSSLTVTVTF